MKKILFICFGLVFTSQTFSQASINISGPSIVEVGVPNNYTFTFNPVYPFNSNQSVQADSYIITEWIVSTGTNGNSFGIPGYIGTSSNQSNYYYDGTYNNSNPKTIPIQWGDGSNFTTDNIVVKISGIYRKSSTGENIGYFNYQPQATKSVTVERLIEPIIAGASTIASCNQTNQTYSISNGTNSDQRLWLVSGATIIGSNTGTSVTIKPGLTGNINISCTVKRSSANSNYSKNGNKTVTRQPFTSNATIIGGSFFCTSSNYSLTGLLANQTVEWSLSKPNFFGTLSSTTSPTTTLTAGIKQGEINLIAKISNSCGEFVTITKEITIGVNGLNAVLTTPSGYPYSYPYYNVPESCSAPLYVFKTSSKNTNLNNPTKKMQFSCNGITVEKLPIGNYYFFLYASDFNISEGNSFVVSAKAGNSCGFAKSTTTFTLYRPTPCQCGTGVGCYQLPRMANQNNNNKEKLIFKLFPIPSNDVINIELENATNTPKKSNISIFDMIGTQVANFEILGDKAIIDVKQYSKGIYILKINSDDKEENHQIIVK